MKRSRFVEYRDATSDERAVRLCNSGVVMAQAWLLFDLLGAVDNNNAAGEYYFTDIVAIVRPLGKRAMVVRCDEAETLGVNTPDELARAETLIAPPGRKPVTTG